MNKIIVIVWEGNDLPSVNHYWITIPSQKCRRVLSDKGKTFREEIILECRNACNYMPFPKPCTIDADIRVTFKSKGKKRDLDNILKPIFDAMEGYLFEDDNQIDRISIARVNEKSSVSKLQIMLTERRGHET